MNFGHLKLYISGLWVSDKIEIETSRDTTGFTIVSRRLKEKVDVLYCLETFRGGREHK